MTDRLTLVRECIHAARCSSRMSWTAGMRIPALVESRRDWMRKARTWRDHYDRELRLNAEWLSANRELAARYGVQ